MPFPLSAANRGNANTAADIDLYKDMTLQTFIIEMESKTGMSLFVDMQSADKNVIIKQPVFDKVGAPVQDHISCLYAKTSSWNLTQETLLIQSRIYENYEYCPEDYSRLEVQGVIEEMDRRIRLDLHYALDKVAMATAIAAAGTTIAAVTDAATAKAALAAVRNLFIGKTNVQNPLVAVIPSTMSDFFTELGASRITAFGDRVFVTGEIQTIDGITLYIVDAAQLDDPTKVVFFAGKPVNYYYDKNTFDIYEDRVIPPTGFIINKNMVRQMELQGDFIVWSQKEERIVVAG